jgi:hypothetical protein
MRHRNYQFSAGGETVRVVFFLMETISEGKATESRETGWFPYAEAVKLLTHAEGKKVLEAAERKRLNHGTAT